MKKLKRSRDVNKLASQIVGIATGQIKEPVEGGGKNLHAVALGRLGGLRGGKARAQILSKEQRTTIAKKAALARWKKKGSSRKKVESQ